MNPYTFFGCFDQLTDSPDAVTKVRELIFESAIRGNLVPRNSSDEPAYELLNRIAKAHSGHGRKQAALPPVDDDAYLQIPVRWGWTRLGNTGRIFNGDSVNEIGKVELSKVTEGLPFIATKDVGYGRASLVYDNGLRVPIRDTRFKVAHAKAVLICAEGGSAGRKIGITDRDICFGNKLFANEVWDGIDYRYILYVYQAPSFFKEFTARMTGIIGGIARSEFLSLPIPIPPEEEQKRIAAKVDELMALCDRLEAHLRERESREAMLARAALARFAEAPTPENLELLFQESFIVEPADLRKAILNLAVRGMLVPQDPGDEPAISLLKRIDTLRDKLPIAARAKDRKRKAGNTDAPQDFQLPISWTTCRLGDLVYNFRYGTSRKCSKTIHGVPVLRIPNIQNGQINAEEIKFTNMPNSEATELQLRSGDLLFIRSNGSKSLVGRCAVISEKDERYAYAGYLLRVRMPQNLVFSQYIYHVCNSQEVRDQIEGPIRTTSGVKNINTTELSNIMLPLPPLAEQRRIVAKVDQLMVLVDQYETQLTASRMAAENLLESMVAELTT